MTLRPTMRPEQSAEESPRERAARRTAELRGHDTDLGDDGNDEYYIESGIIPDGWMFQSCLPVLLPSESESHSPRRDSESDDGTAAAGGAAAE